MEKEYRILVLKMLLAILLKLGNMNAQGWSKREASLFNEVDKFVRKMSK
jgi:hypothetical protein